MSCFSCVCAKKQHPAQIKQKVFPFLFLPLLKIGNSPSTRPSSEDKQRRKYTFSVCVSVFHTLFTSIRLKAKPALHEAIHHFRYCYSESCSPFSRFSSTKCYATAAIGLITDITLCHINIPIQGHSLHVDTYKNVGSYSFHGHVSFNLVKPKICRYQRRKGDKERIRPRQCDNKERTRQSQRVKWMLNYSLLICNNKIIWSVEHVPIYSLYGCCITPSKYLPDLWVLRLRAQASRDRIKNKTIFAPKLAVLSPGEWNVGFSFLFVWLIKSLNLQEYVSNL